MPRPKKPELQKSRDDFGALKPLPRYYGVRVADHFPEIDIYKLGQAVAGRIIYEEGYNALKAICLLYPRKSRASKLLAA
jgi:hypothetical protein